MGIRVVFMGTPAFAVPSLQQLIEDETFDVVAVVTQPDRPAGRGRALLPSPVKRVALTHDIPIFQPEHLRNNPKMLQILRDLAPDVVVVAAYGLILPASVLEVPPHGCVNVHASLLPRYRGAAPVAAAILNGDEETGITIMLMDEQMDHGPILAQRSLAIKPDDTRETLSERLAKLGAALLVETLPQWVSGHIEPQPQDHSAATYARMLKKEDGKIDWTRPAAYIARMTRAYDPWPGAYTYLDGRLLKLLRARAIDFDVCNVQPGEVIETDQGLAVAAGDGAVLLERVQLAGKRAMDIDEFARGQRNLVGTVLGT
ncbi:MAG: methionyl-tRNA formyltransferase [Chloroflexi bacterium]|nr:MAG: methionyl-tRNA formyltransferase [Chloroflexota bacterium]